LAIAGVLLVGSRAPAAAQDKFRVASGGFSTAIHADDGHFSYDYYLAKHGAGVLVMPERKGLEFIVAQLLSTTESEGTNAGKFTAVGFGAR
jgi:hypothetical protein